jgi:hypothetical protein
MKHIEFHVGMKIRVSTWSFLSIVHPLQKFDFEIKTELTLHALVAILIVAVCSGSLASIAIYLDNPLPGIYCATILAIIVFLALRFNSC